MFQINFPTQTTPGVYSIVIGPNIADYSGTLMDQDLDSINGGADDIFTGRFFLNGTAFVPAILGHDPGSGQLRVAISNGNNGFSDAIFASISTAVTWVDVVTGDFNGDGKTDVAARVLQSGQWWVGINTGNAFSFSLWTTWSPNVTWVDVHAADFTGDGKDDIVGRYLQGGQWWVATSLGAERLALVTTLAQYTTTEARILWEDRPGTGSRWTALLPVLTGRTFLGGLDPEGAVEHGGDLGGCASGRLHRRRQRRHCRPRAGIRPVVGGAVHEHVLHQ